MADDKIINLFSVLSDRKDEENIAIKDSVTEAFQKAQEQDLKDVMIMGWTHDGQLVLSFACDSLPEMLFMLELTKKEMLDAAKE